MSFSKNNILDFVDYLTVSSIPYRCCICFSKNIILSPRYFVTGMNWPLYISSEHFLCEEHSNEKVTAENFIDKVRNYKKLLCDDLEERKSYYSFMKWNKCKKCNYEGCKNCKGLGFIPPKFF